MPPASSPWRKLAIGASSDALRSFNTAQISTQRSASWSSSGSERRQTRATWGGWRQRICDCSVLEKAVVGVARPGAPRLRGAYGPAPARLRREGLGFGPAGERRRLPRQGCDRDMGCANRRRTEPSNRRLSQRPKLHGRIPGEPEGTLVIRESPAAHLPEPPLVRVTRTRSS